MLPNVEDRAVKEFYTDFERDVAVYQHELPRMLTNFPGEFVAILNGQIVGHRPDWKELHASVQERFPNKFVFMERVTPRGEIIVDMDTLEG